MADSAKDKKAAVLERIKALREGRAANNAPAPGGRSGDSKPAKNAPRHASTGHRPQGG